MPPYFYLFQVRSRFCRGDTLGFGYGALPAKPTCPFRKLSVCGSRVHSTPALAPAHTFSGSLKLRLGLTTLVLSLYMSISTEYNRGNKFLSSAIASFLWQRLSVTQDVQSVLSTQISCDPGRHNGRARLAKSNLMNYYPGVVFSQRANIFRFVGSTKIQ